MESKQKQGQTAGGLILFLLGATLIALGLFFPTLLCYNQGTSSTSTTSSTTSGPVLVQTSANVPTSGCNDLSTTCSLTFSGAVTAGDLLIVSEATCDNGNNPHLISVTDSGADVFTIPASSYSGPVTGLSSSTLFCGAAVASATVGTAQGAAKETVTFTLDTQPGGTLTPQWSVSIAEWSHISSTSVIGASGLCASFSTGVCSAVASTSSALSYGQGDLLWGWAKSYTQSSGVGPGFTDGINGGCSVTTASQNPCGEYLIGTGPGSTNFPVFLYQSSSPWVSVGVKFSASTSTSMTNPFSCGLPASINFLVLAGLALMAVGVGLILTSGKKNA